MPILHVIALVVVGLIAGVTGGMLGVGGSIVMIPAMIEVMGPNQHLYQATAMIVNFFVAAPAVYQHRRARAIDLASVSRILPLGVLGVVGGVALSEASIFCGDGETYLRGIFGLFLMTISLYDIWRQVRNRRSTPIDSPPATRGGTRIGWTSALAVALPVGLIAGLLGVGGGVLAVPLQQRLLKLPLRTAIANSAVIIVATSLIGATLKNYRYITTHDGGLQPFILAVILIPTAFVGSLIGSRLTHRLPLRFVKVAFFILLTIASIRLMMGAYHAAPGANASRVQPI